MLFRSDELMEEVDFVSVGSNDLFQFVMAVDRGNSRVADRFDPLGQPFLRVLRQIVLAANKTKTSLTLCGEIAGKPLSAMALLGLGFRSISMSPSSIGPVKAMLLSLDLAKLEEGLLPAIADTKSEKTVREFLMDFADANGVSL